MGKKIAKSKPPLTVNPARREQLVDEHSLEPETLFMDGHDNAILGVASRFGMVLRGWGLVYGGGNVGLMGVVAEAALAAGGEVEGVIPEAMMKWELGNLNLTRLHVVGSMHERKAMMADLADAFIALPGGIGTMDETFEIWTWAQLGLHAKPLGFLDVDGFYGLDCRWQYACVAHHVWVGEVRDNHIESRVENCFFNFVADLYGTHFGLQIIRRNFG